MEEFRTVFAPTPAVVIEQGNERRGEGVWSHERKGERVVVRIEPFTDQPDRVRRAAEKEAERLARFLGGGLEFGWISS